MTIVLTVASPAYVVQVADRRLSISKAGVIAGEHDPVSNKTIVYRCKNAIVVMGYSGIAYIGGNPTDEWLAQVLWGEPITRGPDGVRPALVGFVRRPLNVDIGRAVSLLRSAIDARPEPKRYGLEITIAGWQSKRGRFRPIVMELAARQHKNCTINQHPRFWPRGTDLRLLCIGARVEPSEARAYLDTYKRPNGFFAPSFLDAERVAVELARDVSRRDQTVGPHVLSVVLPKPPSGKGFARFLPETVHHVNIETSGSDVATEVGYSPWIIGPRLLAAPSLMIGPLTHDLGGLSFHVLGPRPSTPVVALHSAAPRPPPP
jgi:hypothetical protein